MNYRIPLFGVCAMTVSTLGCHGETFREKLDTYFTEHAQEIQASIQAWDTCNQQIPEYRITEQELKDAVLHSYRKTIDWMKLSMQHQIRFFYYYELHLYDGDNTAILKNRFDCEQIRARELGELNDMHNQFKGRGIHYPKLVQYQQQCTNYVQDLNYSPDGLRDHLLQTVGRDASDTIAGGRLYYQRTANDAYAIERLNWFFDEILSVIPPGMRGRVSCMLT